MCGDCERILGEIEDERALKREERDHIQWAHDLMNEAASNRDASLVVPGLCDTARTSRDALCWVLGHPDKTRFEAALDLARATLRSVGVEMEKEV